MNLLIKQKKLNVRPVKAEKIMTVSHEMVSYKAPTHISPESSASAVCPHAGTCNQKLIQKPHN
jgi:hypothetical protein